LKTLTRSIRALATRIQRAAFRDQSKARLSKLCLNAVLIEDLEGEQHAGDLMAYAPWQDGVVDTFSGTLRRGIVFYDDYLGTVHARALWNNKTYVVRMGVLNGIHTMVDLLDAELNDIYLWRA
jgi:hypothetical protein